MQEEITFTMNYLFWERLSIAGEVFLSIHLTSNTPQFEKYVKVPLMTLYFGRGGLAAVFQLNLQMEYTQKWYNINPRMITIQIRKFEKVLKIFAVFGEY